MRRIRGWSKTTWALLISGLLWVPVVLYSFWLTVEPFPGTDNEIVALMPELLIRLALVGLGATFALLWVVFTVVQWVRRARFSRR